MNLVDENDLLIVFQSIGLRHFFFFIISRCLDYAKVKMIIVGNRDTANSQFIISREKTGQN